MRKKQIFVLLIVFAFINVGMVSLAFFATAKSDNGVRPLEEMAMMDLTHENFVKKEAKAHEVTPIGFSIGQPAVVGDEYSFLVSDDYLGIDYLEDFKVLLEGDHVLILITIDAYNSWDGTYYHFDNPNGDGSEPWLRTEDLIPHEQFVYLMNEFDNNIYPKMASVYGVPNSRPTNASDPDYEDRDKIWTLIFNIRDDAYYDPDAESYIAGYFSLSDNNFYQKNIFHIDTYDWANRVGPSVARPYLYEGVFCHEYEHMIHTDIDIDEPLWVDEGLADMAAYICGYGHDSGNIAQYMLYHPWTSLIFWGNSLEDYGCAYLFALYLYEKFGEDDFISDLVQEQANGIEGIQNTLDAWGHDITFDEIYDAFTIAVYFDDLDPNSPYGFRLIDIGTEDTWGWSINYVVTQYWLPPNFFKAPRLWSWSRAVGGSLPYTAHYYPFGSPLGAALVYLEGDILSGPGPYSGNYAWWSDVGAWAWRSFYKEGLYIPSVGTTLNFRTYFEIEWNWDYGYVEVYDHDDDTWTTLYDPAVVMYDDYGDPYGMVDFIGHPQDNPNCPDGREPTDYLAAVEWHGFSGYSDGWIPVSMDLSDFADHTIDLYFTTWQDGAYTLQMMYVDDIEITNGVLPFDDVESGPGTWLSTGWSIYECLEVNNYQGTIIATFKEPQKNPTGNRWEPLLIRELLWMETITMDVGASWFFPPPPTEVQLGWTVVPTSPPKNEFSTVLIVSNQADHILPSNHWAAFLNL